MRSGRAARGPGRSEPADCPVTVGDARRRPGAKWAVAMLVRLNQIDPRSADGAAGWTTGGVRGTVAYAWPATAFAYQLVALDADEAGRPVAADARRAEVRRVLPAVIGAVGRAGEVTVLRLDGPFGPGLVPAVAAAAGAAAYAVSAVQRFGFDAAPPLASVRLAADAATVERLCRDERLALHAGVRLRAFLLPAALVDPMVDTAEPDDERWRELLPAAGAVVSTAADLLSVVIWSATLGRTHCGSRLAAGLDGR